MKFAFLIVTGNVCKERWTRIRDNYRKALNLRKTKSGQAASKLKPPKFFQELSFLVPYLNDEEERRSNLSPTIVNNDDETQLVAPSDSSNLDTSDAGSQESIESVRTVGRKSTYAVSQTSQGSTVANVLQQYLTRTEQNRNQSDPLLDFFINMAKTVKTFPLSDQIQIKSHLFQMVNNVEMRLATTPINPEYSDSNLMASGSNEREKVRIISNVMVPAPTRSNTTMFNSPAMNKITTVASTPSVNNTLLYVMSPPPPPAMNETLHNLSPAMFSRSSTPYEMPPSPRDETMSSRANSETLHMMSSQENVNFKFTCSGSKYADSRPIFTF